MACDENWLFGLNSECDSNEVEGRGQYGVEFRDKAAGVEGCDSTWRTINL